MMLKRLALASLVALAPSIASAQFATIGATPAVSDNGDRLATTAWVNLFATGSIPLQSGKIFVGSAGNLAVGQTLSGDCTLSLSGVITCTQAAGNFQVIGNLSVGGSIIDGNGILATNIAAPGTPSAGTTRIYVDSTTKTLSAKNDAGTVSNTVVASVAVANQFMTGISTAGVITRAQPAVTDLSGLGTGMATWLGTPSSANLRATVTDETGTGALYFQGGDIGTPSAGVGTNLTSLNASNLASGTVAAARGGAGTINGALTANGSGVVSQAACANLSDCTTGTWVPTITAAGTAGTPTYSGNTNGSYTKIGTQVTAWFRLQTTAWSGSPTGNLGFAGLPFTSSSATQNFGTCFISQFTVTMSAGTAAVSASINPSATVGTFLASGNTGSVNIDASTAGAAISLIGVCIYHT